MLDRGPDYGLNNGDFSLAQTTSNTASVNCYAPLNLTHYGNKGIAGEYFRQLSKTYITTQPE